MSKNQKSSPLGFFKENRVIIIFLITIGTYFFFYQAFYSLIIEKFLFSFFDKTGKTFFGDIFFGVMLVLVVFVFFKKARKIKVVANDFIIPIAILAIYLPHRLVIPDQHWEYIKFKNLNFLCYSDSIVALLLFLTFTPQKIFHKQGQITNELLEDDIYNLFKQDIFERLDYAKRLAQLINCQNTSQSFAIAITGSWGSGKTVFLKQIESEIKEAIVIKFNPWLSKASSNILQDFFLVVTEKIQPYDKSLFRKLKIYSKTILSLEDKIGVKLSKLWGLEEDSINYASLEKQKKSIVGNLEDQSIKLVIIIDDLDRLDGDEVLNILSLIRNTFNFPNVFFLTAFDYSYILETVTKKKIPSPSLFLEKIFQLDIDLPSFPNYLLKTQLIQLLLVNKDDFQGIQIKNGIEIIDEKIGLKKVLGNLRECVRFANSFNHVYDKKSTEIDILDFLLIEFIKLKNKRFYQKLRDDLSLNNENPYLSFPIFAITDYTTIKFNSASFLKEKPGQKTLNSLLDFLFNRTDNFDGVKSLRVPGNAVRYFSDHLFGNISFESFDLYKTAGDYQPFINFLNECIKDGKKGQITDLLLRVNQFSTKQSFVNYCKGILVFCNLTNDYTLVSSVYQLLNRQSNSPIFPAKADYHNAIYNLLKPSVFPFMAESLVAGEILLGFYGGFHFDNNELEKDKLKAVLLANFKLFLEDAKIYDNRSLIIHHKIIDRVEEDTRHIVVDEQANLLLRNYIMVHSEEFLRSELIIRSGPQFVLEPFIDQYLTWPEFEKLLSNSKDDLEMIRLKTFYYKYKANSFNPIQYPAELQIISSSQTLFIGSEDHPHLANSLSVERSGKNPYSDRLPVLHNAKWISHTEKLSLREQQVGGSYKFEKKFDLTGLEQSVAKATIHFLVDDFLSIEINGKKLNEEHGGFNTEPIQVDVTNFIEKSNNSIIFTLRNISFDKQISESEVESNPCEFIYNLVIELEKELDF